MIFKHLTSFCFMVLAFVCQVSMAQSQTPTPPDTISRPSEVKKELVDTIRLAELRQDSVIRVYADSLDSVGSAIVMVPNDSLLLTENQKIDKSHWVPNSKKALWLAIVFPGGGQIYNRKYWKLPLFYGGFLGCVYAISWNNTMYTDYSRAFIDIMSDDPNAKSYMNFIPATYNVEANRKRLQELFRKKKDYYRRYRDLSIFVAIGVYVLSIIDAYVDAELSSFDISKDLSMKVRPSVINNHSTAMRPSGFKDQSYGIQCSLNF